MLNQNLNNFRKPFLISDYSGNLDESLRHYSYFLSDKLNHKEDFASGNISLSEDIRVNDSDFFNIHFNSRVYLENSKKEFETKLYFCVSAPKKTKNKEVLDDFFSKMAYYMRSNNLFLFESDLEKQKKDCLSFYILTRPAVLSNQKFY